MTEKFQGGILAIGTFNNGLTIYVKDERLIYDHNAFTEHTVFHSDVPIPHGEVVLGVDQARVSRGPASVKLTINESLVGQGIIKDIPAMISSIGMDIGSNPTGVSDAYPTPFEFTGILKRLEITTQRSLRPDDELALEIRQALGTQ